MEGLHLFETPDFETQFAQREEFEVTGGTAEVVDIRPEHTTDDMPVFLAPAWACSIDTYKPAIKNLVAENRRVISLNHPRFGGDMSIAPEEAVKKYPEAELRKALNIIDVIDEKGIVQVDAIGHSESAINLCIAAMLHPEKFRNIVFFAPAGLIGEDTFTRLLKGFAHQNDEKPSLKASEGYEAIGEGHEDEKKKAGKTFIMEGLKYITNPVRSLQEGLAISKSDIHEMLRYLHEKGIGIALMTGVDDPVFPMDKMQEIVKADMLDGFLSVRGGHGEIGGIGEHAELYMKGIAEMLANLKAKKEREQAEKQEKPHL